MAGRDRSPRRLSKVFFGGSNNSSSTHVDHPPSSLSPAPLNPKRSSNKLSKAYAAVTNHTSSDSYVPPRPTISSMTSDNILPPSVARLTTDPSGALLPPPSFGGGPSGPRVGSPLGSPNRSRPTTPVSSRPMTPTLDLPHHAATERPASPSNVVKKRRSWLPGSSHKLTKSHEQQGPAAWVVGHGGRVPYNLGLLLNAQKVPELWNDAGDTLVYLHPRTSGKGPCFRIDSSVFAASPVLTNLAFGELYSATSDRRLNDSMADLSVDRPTSPRSETRRKPVGASSDASSDSRISSRLSDSFDSAPRETHLYLPMTLSTDSGVVGSAEAALQASRNDVEKLVSARNLFAFLIGQSLVATERHPTLFAIFMRIADLLRTYEFSNFDGTTFGEVADTSFNTYIDELNLADVRASREKTIEAIVLGEKMRSFKLYNEGFVHGVGKLEDIKELDSPKFSLISPVTINRLERASIDLDVRCKNISLKLDDFDFPAIFAGIMGSKTADERKYVNFAAWRDAFLSTRKFFLSYYKHKYGSWPPKASSKKNDLETSGLNRLVLLELYHDFSSLYDLLADRSSLTTRVMDVPSQDTEMSSSEAPSIALRRVLSEYDRSTPPVQPPVPFDIPLLPSVAGTKLDPTGALDPRKATKARTTKLKHEDLITILNRSHNRDCEISTPFLDAFRDLERKSGHGHTIDDLVDLRMGQWIFMYAVLQSLPMLVVDAPGIRFTRGVEYFLCEPPRSDLPWAAPEASGLKKNWYGIAGRSGLVSLPTDVVEHGVEGVYRRSHCWQMAERWTADAGPVMQEAVRDGGMGMGMAPGMDLPPPPTITGSGVRSPSPGVTLGGSPILGPSISEVSLSRGSSPGFGATRSNRDSALLLGLEALPLPAGVQPQIAPDGGLVQRPVSRGRTPLGEGGGARETRNTSMTFDDILGSMDTGGVGKKGKKR